MADDVIINSRHNITFLRYLIGDIFIALKIKQKINNLDNRIDYCRNIQR